MGSHTQHSVQIQIMMKYTALLLLGVLHSCQGLCFINKGSSWWSNAKKNSTITGACAVLFDENCCDTGDTHLWCPGTVRARCAAPSAAVTRCPAARGPGWRTTWRASL